MSQMSQIMRNRSIAWSKYSINYDVTFQCQRGICTWKRHSFLTKHCKWPMTIFYLFLFFNYLLCDISCWFEACTLTQVAGWPEMAEILVSNLPCINMMDTLITFAGFNWSVTWTKTLSLIETWSVKLNTFVYWITIDQMHGISAVQFESLMGCAEILITS